MKARWRPVIQNAVRYSGRFRICSEHNETFPGFDGFLPVLSALGFIALFHHFRAANTILPQVGRFPMNLSGAVIYDEYSIGPSIRPICTRCFLNITNMIQVCSIPESRKQDARVTPVVDASPSLGEGLRG